MLLIARTLAVFLALLAIQSAVVRSAHAVQDDVQAEVEDLAEESESSSADDNASGDHAEAEHAGDDHAEHDTDTTHANLSAERWKIVDFRTDIAFFTAIVFLLLLAALWFTAWKPIMEGLEKREKGIARNIADAAKAAADAEGKLAEYDAKLATASQEAQGILAEARKDAEATGQKLIAAAQEEAVRHRERATVDIESAKRVALGELANQSTDVAMSLAQRIVGREVKASDHQGLIQDMLSKLPSNN